MKLKNLFTNDRAVSPVIGVILMVAITVILAAVIGTFVIGLGDDLGSTAPQASFDVSNETDSVTFTHRSGDRIPENTAFITTSGGDITFTDADNGDVDTAENRIEVTGDLTAGSSVTAEFSGDETGTVTLVYDDGDRSTTLKSIDIE